MPARVSPAATYCRAGISVVLSLSIACNGGDQDEEPATVVPLLALGQPETILASADPDAELLRAWSAARLGDGRIAVANGRPVELRLYRADGSLERVVGRAGEGPGEYRGRLEVFATPGDSLLVWDHGTRRWQLFGPDGGFVRLVDEGDPAVPEVRLLHRSLIAGSAVGTVHCGGRLVEALGLPSAVWREVLPTRDGVFWVREGHTTMWRAHELDGRAIGEVRLPDSAQVLEAGGGWFLVREASEGEADRIAVLPVSTAMPTADDLACPATPDAPVPLDSARVDEFERTLREAMVAGEMHYADRAAYPARVEELTSRPEFTLPADSDLGIMSSSTRGWSAIVTDRRSSLACAFGIGEGARIGWSEGQAVCAM